MKRFFLFAAAALLLASCNSNKSSLKTECSHYADSSKYVSVTMDLELPSSEDTVSSNIRRSLLDFVYDDTSSVGFGDIDHGFDQYSGDDMSSEAIVKYLGSSTFSYIEDLVKEDEEEREEFESLDELPVDAQWAYAYNLRKYGETESYVVFGCDSYFFAGGAHGNSVSYTHTFSKADGCLVKNMVDHSSASEMQEILRSGLIRYFKENEPSFEDDDLSDALLVDADDIPLPSNEPYPTDEGLVFVYQQYEVAPYACGMPAFTVAYRDIAPYLTPEASALLGL